MQNHLLPFCCHGNNLPAPDPLPRCACNAKIVRAGRWGLNIEVMKQQSRTCLWQTIAKTAMLSSTLSQYQKSTSRALVAWVKCSLNMSRLYMRVQPSAWSLKGHSLLPGMTQLEYDVETCDYMANNVRKPRERVQLVHSASIGL